MIAHLVSAPWSRVSSLVKARCSCRKLNMEDSLIALCGQNLPFVEDLFELWEREPSSVPEDWRRWFNALRTEGTLPEGARVGPSFIPPRLFTAGGVSSSASPPLRGVSEDAVKQERLAQLVRAFRERGHLIASLDPLGLPRPPRAELEPEFHGLTREDLERPFSAKTIHGPDVLTLSQIIERLRNTYCRAIGVQYRHIADAEVRDWLEQRMESSENRAHISRAEQVRILTKLTDAVMFEEFLQTKYLGAKIFSLEGSESLIPLLSCAIDRAGDAGVDDVVLGMAHRGRLNVLANTMGKAPREIFREFEDRDPELFLGSGDVKYHLGYASHHHTPAGARVRLSLCFNPSHLEFVNPVAVGRTRARQDRAPATPRSRKMTILIHGDAAVAGEGVIQETLNISQLQAYETGGTLHVVINNQIGFTTPPWQGRSTTYATDIARMLDIPIFHVNGEDPEAVAQVVDLAVDFRQRFGRDVFIDMYGYRRYGHNEGDEPTFTQPLLYDAITRRRGVRAGYLDHLLRLGGVTVEEADQIAIERRNVLERELYEARRTDYVRVVHDPEDAWKLYRGGPESSVPEVETAVDLQRLTKQLDRLTRLPETFRPNRKIERLLEQRREMSSGERLLDWGAGEALALSTLVTEGIPVRMTGQDCERGTFSHRHSVLHDITNGDRYMPLAHLEPDQASIDIHNSALCETAVLGFEYGYSLERPEGLTIWEAQFGDFVNVAQVIIDQFIVSAEDKWKQLSGLTLLLPHGYEGMGPEHSSARMERWLLLAAEENIQVAQPTTPAQLFHLLRRQALRPWRKPLVILSPKSLLRHPKATSALSEFSSGRFQRILPDPVMADLDSSAVRRVILCTGKAFYSLEQRREELGCKDVALVRLEQLYPLPDEHLRAALQPYASGVPVVWTQEEPENMGAWRHLRARFGAHLFSRHPLGCISRAESASPATGSASSHKLEQEELLEKAFAPG